MPGFSPAIEGATFMPALAVGTSKEVLTPPARRSQLGVAGGVSGSSSVPAEYLSPALTLELSRVTPPGVGSGAPAGAMNVNPVGRVTGAMVLPFGNTRNTTVIACGLLSTSDDFTVTCP